MATAGEITRERVRDAKRALYRDAVLDAAEEAFAEHGYNGTRVQAIARAAGLSLTTLYGAFDTKREMFRAVHERRLSALLANILRGLDGAESAFARIQRGIEVYLRFHMAHPSYLRMHLREGTAWATVDELGTPEQTRAWRFGLRLMVAAFEQAMAEGAFVRDDPELMARTAIAMHQVRLALWVDRGMTEPPDRVAGDAARQLVRAFGRPERLDALLEQSEVERKHAAEGA
ncbi:MAG: TetR/AcrR family transcriptional regulator [Myxococcales bacterium]|nr:TetR/AcrR family transcriptional regulator [Myxococcales bacterium]